MGFFDFIFGKKGSSSLLEEMDRENERFISKNPAVSEEDAMMRNAASLMTSGRFKESLDAYLLIAEKFPEKKGLYQSQVGANYYFLGEFEKAIEYYVEARGNGMDASMIDDNIWEALEALYGRTKDKKYLRRYLELCPNGAYTKKVNKLI